MKHLIVLFILILFSGCKKYFPEADNISKEHFSFTDQNGNSKKFPDFVNGKTTVISYIFTNCPDICPLTTNNMRLIQERLKKEKITEVQFISISFDPIQDTPQKLNQFAAIRNLDLSNWTFLIGTKATTDSLLKRMSFIAVIGDSTEFGNGKKTYFYVHTDRIQLMDGEGIVRKSYKGSSVNVDEIVSDIKLLK